MSPKNLKVRMSLLSVLVVLLLVVVLPRPLLAVDYDDLADGNWSTPGTWSSSPSSPGTYPDGTGDTALINGTRTIDVDVSVAIDSLTVTGNAIQTLNGTTPNTLTVGTFVSNNINNFIIGAGLSVDITGTGLYSTRGGTVNGTINVLNGATLTYTMSQTQSGSGGIHVQAGGKIDMQSASYYNQYDSATGMTVDNDGLFEFNNSGLFNIRSLNINGDGEWRINSGGMSFNSSTQTIALNPATATWTGAAGTVKFDNVANTTHTLGSFNMSGTNTVEFADSLSATYQVNGPSTFQNMSLTAGDVVDLAPSGGGAQTHAVNGTLTLTTGSLTASDAAGAVVNANDLVGPSSSATIDTGVTLNLAGTGSLSGNGSVYNYGILTIQNGGVVTTTAREMWGTGTINVDSGGTFTLDGTANSNRRIDPDVVNNGLIRSVSNNIRPLNGNISGTGTFRAESGTLDVDAATVAGWTGTGTLASAATWHAQGLAAIDLVGSDNAITAIGSNATVILEDGGRILQLNASARNNLTVEGALYVRGTSNLAFNAGQGVTINSGGMLGGNLGTITGDVTVIDGMVEPGDSVGTLYIDGNVEFQANGGLVVELASDSSYDILNVTGDVTFLTGSSLNIVDLYGAGLPSARYDIITVGAGGTLSGWEGIALTGSWRLAELTPGTLTLQNAPEPASLVLLGLGLGAVFRRRRR